MDLGAGRIETRDSGPGRSFDILPSQLFRDHISICFIEDPHGAANLAEIGVDNVLIEVDYPHPDSNWPNTVPHLRKQLAGQSDEDLAKIFQGNAKRLFNFTPAPSPT
jgi:hypothetical protein